EASSCDAWKIQRTTSGLAAQVTAETRASPPAIVLSWATNPTDTTSIDVYRRAAGEASFHAPIAAGLPASTTIYTDNDVSHGVVYEYYVERQLDTKPWWSVGHLASAIEAPLVEARGTVVLVIEESIQGALAGEIERLAEDLLGDGWNVARIAA